MSRGMLCAAFVGFCATLVGCAHQRMEVSVELIEPAGNPDTSLNLGGADYRAALDETIAALNAQMGIVDKVEAFYKGLLGANATNRLLGAPEKTRERIAEFKERAASLREQATSHAKPPEELHAAVGELRNDVAAYSNQERKQWTGFVRSQNLSQGTKDRLAAPGADPGRSRQLENEVRRDQRLVDSRLAAAQDCLAGAGGFRVEGVYWISPADPLYPAVLKGRPVGAPLSYASGDALGDSSVMFVQESPVQIRVAEIKTDSTQLMDNVLKISQKALTAAARYYGVPAPDAAVAAQSGGDTAEPASEEENPGTPTATTQVISDSEDSETTTETTTQTTQPDGTTTSTTKSTKMTVKSSKGPKPTKK